MTDTSLSRIRLSSAPTAGTRRAPLWPRVAAILTGLLLGAGANASGPTVLTMVGTVSNPASLTLTADSTSVQTLTDTLYDLSLGTIPAGQSWANASFGISLNVGQFASVPTAAVTDATGASIAVTAAGTIATGSSTSTGNTVGYKFSGDLPANAVVHFSGFALTGLSSQTAATAIQISAAAGGGTGTGTGGSKGKSKRSSGDKGKDDDHSGDKDGDDDDKGSGDDDSGDDGGTGTQWRSAAAAQTLATIGSTTTSSATGQSGWWWSSSEPGRGYAIEIASGHMMFAAYMYRADGSSVWYVTSGPLSGASFTGTLNEYTGGGTLGGNPQPASLLGSVGTVTVTFSSATQGTILWGGSVFGSTAPTSTIVRFPFSGSSSTTITPPATSSAPETGWYWNAAEGGTGWFIEMQGSQIFLATYMYNADGTARWYVALGAPIGGGVFGSSGGLLLTATLDEYAGGQTLTSGPRPNLTTLPQGQITVQFTSTTTATVTLPDGRQVQLSRFTQF
ncbi:MAG: hypothetical protein HYR63_14075 [Proteobacteria bacterium]|nr:hypothetical protein [Pseudomonadota bacterium]